MIQDTIRHGMTSNSQSLPCLSSHNLLLRCRPVRVPQVPRRYSLPTVVISSLPFMHIPLIGSIRQGGVPHQTNLWHSLEATTTKFSIRRPEASCHSRGCDHQTIQSTNAFNSKWHRPFLSYATNPPKRNCVVVANSRSQQLKVATKSSSPELYYICRVSGQMLYSKRGQSTSQKWPSYRRH